RAQTQFGHALVFATLLRLASTHVPPTSHYFANPRIFRRLLAESKIFTAQLRACLDSRGQSVTTSFAASSASSRPLTKRNPLYRGKYSWAPVSSVITGRPSARNVAARSLNHPVRQATSTPLIAVNSPNALAT